MNGMKKIEQELESLIENMNVYPIGNLDELIVMTNDSFLKEHFTQMKEKIQIQAGEAQLVLHLLKTVKKQKALAA